MSRELEQRQGIFLGETTSENWIAIQHILGQLGVQLEFRSEQDLALTNITKPRAREPYQPEPGSVGSSFLRKIIECPNINSASIADQIGADPAIVSRTGRRLVAGGFAVKHKAGRCSLWEATEMGKEYVSDLNSES